jgi:hypothetical protein
MIAASDSWRKVTKEPGTELSIPDLSTASCIRTNADWGHVVGIVTTIFRRISCGSPAWAINSYI